MSQFMKFYFTSSVLNIFRTLTHPSSRSCDFFILSPHWLCVLVSMCVGVSVWLVGVVSVWQAEVLQLATFLLYHHIGRVFLFRCVLKFPCGWVGVVSVWQTSACYTDTTLTSHTETPTHNETRTHNQYGDKIEKQAEALQPATRIPLQPNHTETPTHIETRTHN